MESLKPCPVCGNSGIDGWTYGEGSVPFIPENVKDLTWGCEEDACPYSLDKPITVEVWNKRTTDRLEQESAEFRELATMVINLGKISDVPISITSKARQILNK